MTNRAAQAKPADAMKPPAKGREVNEERTGAILKILDDFSVYDDDEYRENLARKIDRQIRSYLARQAISKEQERALERARELFAEFVKFWDVVKGETAKVKLTFGLLGLGGTTVGTRYLNEETMQESFVLSMVFRPDDIEITRDFAELFAGYEYFKWPPLHPAIERFDSFQSGIDDWVKARRLVFGPRPPGYPEKPSHRPKIDDMFIGTCCRGVAKVFQDGIIRAAEEGTLETDPPVEHGRTVMKFLRGVLKIYGLKAPTAKDIVRSLREYPIVLTTRRDGPHAATPAQKKTPRKSTKPPVKPTPKSSKK
ncbi:MAG: hypothetical protein IT350_19785 [Deltaproteobacteria bacterium]|nr:hypothetical protein [Deltaproteobacteria bacterium]